MSYDENKSDSGDNSKSTVISFPTSLPIQFSSQSSLSTSQSRSKDLLATPPTFKMRSLPAVMETVKSSASAPVTPMKREKSGSHQGVFVTTFTLHKFGYAPTCTCICTCACTII